MVSAENEGWMSIRVYRNKRRRRGRGGGDQKGSARKQRTKVGEFPLGRDKEEMRRQRGETERRRRSRAGEVEKDDRGCPSWSPEDIRGLIEFTSSLVGPTDVGRAGRSVFRPDSTYAISARPFPPGMLHWR